MPELEIADELISPDKVLSLSRIQQEDKKHVKLEGRFDEDLRLYWLEKFVLNDTKGNAIKNAEHITMNDPKTLADRVIATLSHSQKSFNIVGIDASIQRRLEEKYKLIFANSDENNENQGLEPVNDALDYMNVLRGWSDALVIMYYDETKDVWLPNIIGVDPKGSRYEYDKKGLIWFSYNYRISASDAFSQWGYESPGGSEINVKACYNREWYWNYNLGTDDNIATAGTVLGTPVNHGLGIVPALVKSVPTQPLMLNPPSGEDAFSHKGESIYGSNRTLYPALNSLMSISATMAKMQFMSPLAFISPAGRKPADRPYGIGVVVPLKTGEQFIEIPTKELTAAMQFIYSKILAGIQRGGLTYIEEGGTNYDLSALAMSKLSEASGFLYACRLKAKERMNRDIAFLIKKQVNKGGWKTSIEDDENFINLDKIDDFDNTFAIQVEFNAVTPEENISQMTNANNAKMIGFSKFFIMKNIMKVDDPEGEIRRADLDAAHELSPTLRAYDWLIAEAPGEMTEDEIKQDRATILYNDLTQLMTTPLQSQQAGPLGQQQPGTPNVPKLNYSPPKAAAEKVVNEKNRRTIARETKTENNARNTGT